MKTIHYIDYCTMGMLKRLAPDAHASLMAHYVYDGEDMLSDTDLVVFEGFRTVNGDGTYGPHNVGKVCSVTFGVEGKPMADIMTGIILSVTSYAYLYGAKHFITMAMARLWKVTDPYVLMNLKETK